MANSENVEFIEGKVSEIMNALGVQITDSNKDTPLRIAKMLCNELFKNINDNNIQELHDSMKLFSANTHLDKSEPIDIEVPFYSMCEHHWLPFFGKVTITYIPDGNIIGLSKIPRVVEYFSKRPQLQERLTQDIGEYLYNIIDPQYLRVEVVAEHLCVSMRGVNTPIKTKTFWVKHKDNMEMD